MPGRTDNEVKNFFHTHLKKNLGQINNIDAPVQCRRVKKQKKKAQEKPKLFVDISSPTMGSSSSISSIITFDQNEKIDMEKTVILESNPSLSSSHSNIDGFDQFVDTTSFWLHLLNHANREELYYENS